MTRYDVLIVGGGTAGLSAALVLGRARRNVLVVDAGRPRNAPAAHMQGFLSRDGMAPGAFLAVGRDEVRRYGTEIVEDTVMAIERDGDGFRGTLGSGPTVAARTVLVTTGLVDELPDVDGVAARWGRDVLHCPYCHGHEVRDRPLGVLATGPMSVHQTLLVRQWSADVTLFLHRLTDLSDEDRERLAARDVRVADGEIAGLVVIDDRLTGVRPTAGPVVPVEALFVGTVLRGSGGVLAALDARTETAPYGTWVAVDPMGRTSVDGVWAAGNVADPMAQVIVAAAAGSRAAADINGVLVTADTDRAVQDLRRRRTTSPTPAPAATTTSTSHTGSSEVGAGVGAAAGGGKVAPGPSAAVTSAGTPASS